MRTKQELRDQINKLVEALINRPEGIKKEEYFEFQYYCKGGISALYWILEEKNPYCMWAPEDLGGSK